MSIQPKATKSTAKETNIQSKIKDALLFGNRTENGLMIAPSIHAGKRGNTGKVGKGEEVGGFSRIPQSKMTCTEFA